MWAGSTCHDGLLAAVMGAAPGGSPSGAGLPETRPHSRVVVVRVEYSSRTLASCLLLCRKCKHSPLWRTRVCRREEANFDHSCFQPLAQRGGEYRQLGQQWTMVYIVVGRERPRSPLCLSPQGTPGVRISRTGLPRTHSLRGDVTTPEGVPSAEATQTTIGSADSSRRPDAAGCAA